MKVYILVINDYEETTINKVFFDKSKANEYRKKRAKTDERFEKRYCDIIVREVNE